MDQSERETAKLWRVHKTIHHMVHDRGYIVSQSELDMSLQDFTHTFGRGGIVTEYALKLFTYFSRSALTFLVQKKENSSDQLFIFFPDDLSVGVKPIRIYCEKMVEQGVFKAIIIYRNSLTPSAEKVMQQMAPKYILEQFKETELLVNITEHQLVPPHILLNDDERKELLDK